MGGTRAWKEHMPKTQALYRTEHAKRMDRGGIVRRDRTGHKTGNLDGD